MLDLISWIATISSLAGQVLINRRNKIAFPVWIISNLLWIAANFIGNFNIANVVMYAVYIVFNVSGYFQWEESERRTDNAKEKS